MAARDFPPKRIMILHIQVHGFVRSAMVNQFRLTVPFESQRTDLHGPCDRQLDYAALFVTAKRCWNPDQQRFNAHRQFRHESTPFAMGNGRGFPFRQRLSCPSALSLLRGGRDRKSTRLNSRSLMRISYAVFCLKKKKKLNTPTITLRAK